MLGPVLSCMRKITHIVVLSGVLVVTFAGAVGADEDIVGGWSPAGATGEQWKPPARSESHKVEVSPTSVCTGNVRMWISADSPTRMTVIWRTCPRGALPLLVTNLSEIFGYTFDPRIPSALPDGADRVALVPTGHLRTWLQADQLIELTTECQSRSREECLVLSAKAARSLAATLPGRPAAGPPDPGPVIHTALRVVLIALAAMVFGVPYLRRRRRVARAGTAGDDRWKSVDVPARSLRGDAATRRFWVSMLWVSAGVGIVILAEPIFSSDTTFSLGSVAPSFFFAIISGYRTFRSTSHPLLSRNWLLHGRTTRTPRRERLITGMLTIFAGTVIVAGWTAVLNLLTYDWYAIHLTDLERAVIAAALAVLMVLAFLAANRAHRAEVRAAWRFFNAAGGVPFAFLRSAADDLIRMRRSPMIRRNGPLRFFDWIRLYPPVPFPPTIALLLARHGKLVALDPPGHRVTGTGAPAIHLPPKDITAHARSARGVLLLAPTEAGWPLAALPKDPATACVLLVIPPWPDAEFDRRFAAFQAVAGIHPVLRELAEPWVSQATLVLAHVPGEGWRGWGARDRTEWTYTVALDAALEYASPKWDRALAERGNQAPAGQEFDDRPKVLVHAYPAPEETRVASEIGTRLATMGINILDSRRNPTGYNSTIVVMSNAALRDPAWVASTVELAGAGDALIPVVVEAINGERPAELSTPNWIDWTHGAAKAIADLFTAVNSRSSIYRKHRDLMGQARTWQQRGRPKQLLISNRQRAEDAARHVEHVERDLRAKPDPLTREFVQASVARSSSLARRLSWWALGITAVLAVTAFAVKVTVDDVRLRNKNNTIGAIVSTFAVSGMNNPGYLGLQSAALLLQGSGEQENLGRRALIDALNQRWPVTFLGSEHDAQMTDVAVGDRSPVYSLDVAGTLTTWDISSAQATARHFVAKDVDQLDMTTDGSLIVVTERTRLHLITPEPWHDDVIDLPAPINQVALAGKLDEVTVALTDGRLVAAAVGKPLRAIGTYQRILSLRSTVDDQSRALVQTGPDMISVVDPASGAVIGTSRVGLPSFNLSAALGSDGQTVAVVDADRRLRFGPVNDLRPTGQFVPDTVDSLVVLTPTALLFASAQFGTQVYDARSGITTGRLVSPAPGATQVRVSPRGARILTLTGHVVFVWQSLGLTSIPEPDVVRNKGVAAQAEQHGVRAAGTPYGEVTVAGRAIPAVTGPVTAVAIADDGRSILVGSDHGEVAEVDAEPGIVVRRWQAPDYAPVTVLGWTQQRPDLMLIRTAPGRWWITEACNGCGSDAYLLAAFRVRLAGCYRPNNVEQITEAVQQALQLRRCEASPRAEVR